MSAPIRHALLLTLTPLLWGFGFVGARWSLEGAGPLWANAYRFLLALALLLVLCARHLRTLRRADLRAACLLGVPLFLAFSFQTASLLRTSIARASFITCLYAVFVPVLAIALGRERARLGHFTLVTLALVGMALLSGVGDQGAAGLGRGELYVLICALACALQILAADVLSGRRPALVLNLLQTACVAVLSVVAALAIEGPPPLDRLGARSIWALLYLAGPSSVGAFSIQLYAQTRLSASVASMIFLLEAPFGALAGLVLEGERHGALAWIGGGLMLVACAAATRLGPRPPPEIPDSRLQPTR